jgi:hypothetical protein
MDPLLWGPCTWSVIFGVAFELPQSLRGVLNELRHLLPCGHCRTSFEYYCRQNPLSTCESEPVLYVWNLRDMVNRKLKRHLISYSTFTRRSQCVYWSVDKNTVHMMMFMSRNIIADRANSEVRFDDRSKHLCYLFDLFASALCVRYPEWMEVRENTRSMNVHDALVFAHATILSKEAGFERYDAAIVPASSPSAAGSLGSSNAKRANSSRATSSTRRVSHKSRK